MPWQKKSTHRQINRVDWDAAFYLCKGPSAGFLKLHIATARVICWKVRENKYIAFLILSAIDCFPWFPSLTTSTGWFVCARVFLVFRWCVTRIWAWAHVLRRPVSDLRFKHTVCSSIGRAPTPHVYSLMHGNLDFSVNLHSKDLDQSASDKDVNQWKFPPLSCDGYKWWCVASVISPVISLSLPCNPQCY